MDVRFPSSEASLAPISEVVLELSNYCRDCLLDCTYAATTVPLRVLLLVEVTSCLQGFPRQIPSAGNLNRVFRSKSAPVNWRCP
jgi:hypothetical protein